MASKVIIGTALCALFVGSSAVAQEPTPTPTPETAAPVAANAEPEPHQGLIKRAFKDDDEDKDGRGIHFGPFVPRIEIMSSGGGPAPVLHFWTPNIGGTPFDIHASASYSINKYQFYDFQMGLLPQRDRKMPTFETGTTAVFPLADLEKTAGNPGFNIYAAARYRDYTREDYYGIGPSAPMGGHSDYRLQDGLYEGVMRFQVSRVSFMGRAGLLKTSILEGEEKTLPDVSVTFNEPTAPGLKTSPDFIHVSGGVWLELRDEPGNAHKGVAFGASFSRFKQRKEDAFDFNRVTFEGREYLPLGSHRNVLAFKQTLAFDDPDDGSAVPFYLRSTLGGGSLLRGFRSFRFRDDRLMYMLGEYRFEAHPRIELALIYDLGKVLPESESVNFKQLRRSWGGGIRLKSKRKVLARLDIVHSDEGNRVHVKLGKSF